MESQLGLIELIWVREALDELGDSFVITDPYISGHPIVYASRGFVQVFGYSKDEVVGRNSRMFQGPGTDRRAVMRIREAIREEKAVQTSLLNYRKDGTPFWMLFHMCPVFSKDDGKVIHFLGVQVPIAKKVRRRSLGGVVRNSCGLSEGGRGLQDIVMRCCRREVMDSRRGLASEYVLNSEDRELEGHQVCEASEQEKVKAAEAVSNILSILTHYSEVTGRLVCGNRCCLPRTALIGASSNISFGRIKQSFVLTDPHLVDMPIVYASDAFLRMTGYARHEVLGRNCRFLSGLDTDPATQYQITECVRAEKPCTVYILNYRKDRTSFWNFLHISPVRNSTGKVAYFVGIQLPDTCSSHDKQGLRPAAQHLSVVGSVKVAVRSLSMVASASTSERIPPPSRSSSASFDP